MCGGKPASGAGYTFAVAGYFEYTDGVRYIFNLNFANVFERILQAVTHLLMDAGGYANAARFRESFKASSNVHALAVDVLAVIDDIAHVDTEAERKTSAMKFYGLREVLLVRTRSSITLNTHICVRQFNHSCLRNDKVPFV